jgi:hypothetical protein
MYHGDQPGPNFKILITNVDSGPGGPLSTAGIENSRIDFWAIEMIAASTGVSSSVVGGVVEEVEA